VQWAAGFSASEKAVLVVCRKEGVTRAVQLKSKGQSPSIKEGSNFKSQGLLNAFPGSLSLDPSLEFERWRLDF
jgi:hypothetical protein